MSHLRVSSTGLLARVSGKCVMSISLANASPPYWYRYKTCSVLYVCHKKNMNTSWRREFFRRWTVSLELSVCHITWQISHLYSSRDFWRQFGLCRAAAHSDCCFFCAVYKYSYLLMCMMLHLGYYWQRRSALYTWSAANFSTRCQLLTWYYLSKCMCLNWQALLDMHCFSLFTFVFYNLWIVTSEWIT